MYILQRGLLTYLLAKFDIVGKNAILMLFGTYLLCLLAGYLLGSLNSAVVVSRLIFRDDVRRHGSGNAGQTNMFRVYGKRGAIPTLVGDMLKTVLSVVIGGILMGFGYVGGFSLGGGPEGIGNPLFFGTYLAAIACVMGHIYPIYYGFKGGKGVLCAFTATLVLCPVLALILLAIFIVIVAATKYISLGSITAAALFPIFLDPVYGMFVHSVVVSDTGKVEGATSAPLYVLVYAFFVALTIVLCHRANIKRLWNHEESKFSFHKKSASAPAKEDESENG